MISNLFGAVQRSITRSQMRGAILAVWRAKQNKPGWVRLCMRMVGMYANHLLPSSSSSSSSICLFSIFSACCRLHRSTQSCTVPSDWTLRIKWRIVFLFFLCCRLNLMGCSNRRKIVHSPTFATEPEIHATKWLPILFLPISLNDSYSSGLVLGIMYKLE